MKANLNFSTRMINIGEFLTNAKVSVSGLIKGRDMREEEKINPGHTKVRNLLRIAGPVVLGLGVIFMLIGIGNFFSAASSREFPSYFWCMFVGMPLVFVGVVMTNIGYFGAVARYMAGETAPVSKDTFNYMADGTKEGIRDITGAIKDGISGDFVSCPYCKESNDSDAKFCNECGKTISSAKACTNCNTENDSKARFCDGCGEKFANASG